MVRTIVIDDETAALTALQRKIELYCPGIDIICLCESSKEGLKKIIEHKPDLVFLDIEMPWMNGFELLSCLGDKLDFQVVFVTAYDQYAIDAFKVKAIDYLLKPVDKDDLIQCIKRVNIEMNRLNKSALDELIQEMGHPLHLKRLMVNSPDGIEIIEMADILYCEAASNYTYIYTDGGKKIITSKSLAEIDKILDETYFLRTHKSYTVNLNAIRKFSSKDGGQLILKNEDKIPVSRRKKEEVLKAIYNLG